MIKIERLTEDIDKEIDRLSAGPTAADLIAFETVLNSQFQATQRAVHVQTRSLKSSGRTSSKTSGNSWEGQISYGGPSDGIHNPVDYAEYERERDGNHDFLVPAVRMESAYVAAMNTYLGG